MYAHDISTQLLCGTQIPELTAFPYRMSATQTKQHLQM